MMRKKFKKYDAQMEVSRRTGCTKKTKITNHVHKGPHSDIHHYAMEGQDVSTSDIPGAFLHTYCDKKEYISRWGEAMANIVEEIDAAQ